MNRINKSTPQREGSVQIRFNLLGLILFSLSMVAIGGLLTSGLLSWHSVKSANAALRSFASSPGSSPAPGEMPAWGELVTSEINVERPEEYLASEVNTNQPPAWVFPQLSREKARSLMLSCGLSEEQASRALSSELSATTSTGVVVRPDEQLLFSLAPETRAKLYVTLGQWSANHYMQYPFTFRGQTVESLFAGSDVDPEAAAKFKKLLYPRAGAECFSDLAFILRDLPSDKARLSLVKALSRQRALLVRLRIRPDTDIDKLLGYWDQGIHLKDARPLLESVSRLPDGGTISLMYLLPQFVRTRLYTFPTPPTPGDPAIDCHWSTMNYFNAEPDNRFADPAYTVAQLKTNYYQISRANAYGDRVFILNKDGNAIHSAVYLADDIVFTKNGNNYEQPWMLVRMKDLLATYTSEPIQVAAYRSRNR